MTGLLDADRTAETEAGAIRDFIGRHQADLVAQLCEWVRIPSVSSVPEHGPDVRRSASWLAGRLREIGFPRTEIWDTDGQPAVFAEWPAEPAAPVTVLVYSHHDVRAVHNDTWQEARPFDPQVRNGRVYGRGASDAKGQLISHLWGIRAHLAATGRTTPAVNLKFLAEGEEETGSAHLGQILADHAERLHADLVVFSDTMLWRLDAPDGHPAVGVLAECMTQAFGKPAGLMRNGGRGPAAMLAGRVAPVVFFGTGRPEDLWHDSDERALIDALCRGAITLALLWPGLAGAHLE